MYYLITYNGIYSETIKIGGIVALTSKEYTKFTKALDILPEDYEFDFFINKHESIEIYGGKNAVLYVLDIKEIDQIDYMNLKRLDLVNIGYAKAFIQAVIVAATKKGYVDEDEEEISDDAISKATWDAIGATLDDQRLTDSVDELIASFAEVGSSN